MWTTEIMAIVLWLTIVTGLAIAVILGTVIWTKQRSRRKAIRYFRWSVKAAFLIVFMVPFAYLLGAPVAPVYSFFSDGLRNSLLTAPLGQSPDAIWLFSFGIKAPGARIVCPLWAVQTVIAGEVTIVDLIPTIVAMLLFLIPIFVLGNMFCGWVCPIGTIIDSFDRLITKFLPKVDSKRVERSMRNKEMRAKQSQSRNVVCPTCPLGRLSGRYGVVANGIIASSFVGSAILRFPVFCTICPIGIATRGVSHLSSITSVTGKFLPVIIELWAIPVVAVLASLREKRFWCKKICPVGALLNIAGSFNPFFKPVVKADKCRMKGCPEDCEDYRLDYCLMCRQIDQKQCEQVCPVDINLTDQESLARCTKCLECYIACESDAIEIKLSGMPDAVPALSRFFKRRRKRVYNPDAVAVFNEINRKSGFKLAKLKIDAKKFDLRSVSKKNVSGFVVRSIKRVKASEDKYYAVKISEQRIVAKDRVLNEEVEIPVSSVGYGLRSFSYIKTIDLSKKEDFIVLSKFSDVNKVIPKITDKTLKSWKQVVEEKATNFLIARRFILATADLSALAFYSNKPIVGVDMWSVKGLSNEEAKLQTLWFNSTPNLLQVYMLGTLDTWMEIQESTLCEFNFLNTEKLSETQRMELMKLFREIGAAELPSILSQLEDKNPLRLKLDIAILKILGYGEAEAVGVLNQLYPLFVEEIKNENFARARARKTKTFSTSRTSLATKA